MSKRYEIDETLIKEQNQEVHESLDIDYSYLAEKLGRNSVNIEDLTARAQAFSIAIPSWGVGTGGTRFARFPGPGEPRDVFEKLEDCAVVQKLVRVTPGVSLHIPWDKPEH